MDEKNTYAQLNDDEIKAALREYDPEDPAAAGRVIGLLWPIAARFAELHCRGRDDWVGEIFLSRLAERFPAIVGEYVESPARFSTWFHRVLMRLWKRSLDRKLRLPCPERVLPEQLTAPEEGNTECGGAGILESSLMDLDIRERLLFRLRYPELMTARAMGQLAASGMVSGCRLAALGRRVDVLCQHAGRRCGRISERLDRIHGNRVRRMGGWKGRGNAFFLPGRCIPRLVARLYRGHACMSYEEIAGFLNRPRGSVASALFRIRKKLGTAIRVRCQGSGGQLS